MLKNEAQINLYSTNIWYNYAQYLLYPPYSVTLIVLYEDFTIQLANRMHSAFNKSIVFIRLLRLIVWYLIIEATLHYLYIPGLFSSPNNVIVHVDLYSLASIAYITGQFFHLKYVVIFGMPAFFAIFDRMTPPNGPICISRVCRYV